MNKYKNQNWYKKINRQTIKNHNHQVFKYNKTGISFQKHLI